MEKKIDPKGKEKKQTNRKKWYKAVCSLAAAVVVCTVYTLMLPALTLDEESAGDAGVTISESAVPASESPAAAESSPSDNGSESHSDTAADSSADSSPASTESGPAEAAPSADSAPSTNEPTTLPSQDGENHTAVTLPAEETNNGAITGSSESQDEVTTPDTDDQEEIKDEESGSPAADSEEADNNGSSADAEEDDSEKSDDTADVETASDWETTIPDLLDCETWAEKLLAVAGSQLGYHESVLNFRVDNDGNHKGYTRYGEWYGNPYGDWCAMFVSFCLNYAGIDEKAIPQNANCADWVKNLKKMEIYEDADLYVPEAGDIVFFDQSDADRPNHVGIISEVTYGTKTVIRHITKDGSAVESGAINALKYINEATSDDASGDELQTEEVEVPVAESIRVIEGNSSDQVQYVNYDLSNEKILGYVSMTNAKNVFEGNVKEEQPAVEQPVVETPTAKEYEVPGDYKITATYTSDAKLPESTTLKARELTGEEYDKHYNEALKELGVEELSFARFFDITFESADGYKLEPAADSSVDVQITYYDDANKPEIKENETANAVHFGENGTEVLPVETTGDPERVESMSFTQSSFSVTGTVVSSNAIADGKYVILSGNSGYVSALVGSNGASYSAYVSDSKVTIESSDSANIGVSVRNGEFKYNNTTYKLIKNTNGLYYAESTEYSGYYLGYSYYSWYGWITSPTVIYLSNNYRIVPKQYTITFNANGGSVANPASVVDTEGTTFKFPDYTGKNRNKIFVGWSTNINANDKGQAAVAPVYSPGTELEITGNVTYYAIYASENVGSCFYIALDGIPRTEPRVVSGTDAEDFTRGIHINNALKVAKFYSNGAGVNSNLNSEPTVDQIARMINNAKDHPLKANQKIANAPYGVGVQDGKLYALDSNKNIDISKELYVVWYVVKCANAGPNLDKSATGTVTCCDWHVDGVLLTKSKVTLYYSPGENVDSTEVKDLPDGSQYDKGTSGVLAGNHKGDNNVIKNPTRTGYTFTGWKAYKYSSTANNHMGDYLADYQPRDPFTIHEDTILVAQWQLNQTGVVLKKVNKNGDSLTGAVFVLRKLNNGVYEYYNENNESKSTYTVNSNNGVNIGMLEDGSYQLQEVTAPDGYNLLTDTIEFTVDNNVVTIATDDEKVATASSAGNGYVISVINEFGAALPETGGTGTLPYLLGGLLLTMPLTIRIIRRRKSEERRKN